MALAVDVSGRYLLDPDGVHVGTVHSAECAERVAAMSLGNVFVSGVGDGAVLARLNALALIGDVVTMAIPQDVNTVIADNYAELYPLDPPVEVKDTLDALALQIDPPGPPYDPFYPWTMGVFDLTVQDRSTDPVFLSLIGDLWPDITGRIVVLSENQELTLAGWVSLPPLVYGGTFVYTFDRFDPDNGIGEANPHGSVYVPGFGWRE